MNIEIHRFGKKNTLRDKKGKKKKSFGSIIIFIIVTLIIIAFVTVGIETLLKNAVASGQEETWIASVASYWGGIISSVISGLLAFLGVFYTIRYYKDSDEQKERASVQHFLLVELWRDDRRQLRSGFSLGPDTDNKETQKQIDIAIRNIGNGFAKTLVINTGTNIGGLVFSKVINVGEEAHTFFVLNKEN